MFDLLARDLAYGWRMLRKSPGFAAVAVLTLALGIGANTAIFSVIDAVMLRSLPVANPQQLVVLRWAAHHWPKAKDTSSYGDCPTPAVDSGPRPPEDCSFSYPMFESIRSQRKVFSGVVGVAGGGQVQITVDGHASLARPRFVSGDFFSTLGVSPFFGRAFGPADDASGAPPVAVLGYGFWQTKFGGRRTAIGQTVLVNGVPTVVAGVAPPAFQGLDSGVPQDLWLPMAAISSISRNDYRSPASGSDSWWVMIVARLRPGVSLVQARAAANVIFLRGVMGGADATFKPADAPRLELPSAARGLAALSNNFSKPLILLMIAVGILLLIACANVAGLLLARAAGRQKEMAVRFALGAGRGRIVRQLLTESLMIAAAGAALGILLAYWGASAMARFFAANWYSTVQLSVAPDFRVLGFAIAVAVVTGLAFGLAPAARAADARVAPALKETAASLAGASSARRWFSLGNGLVAAQVALAMLVLVGAGLLVRTLANLESENVGFNTRHILLFGISPALAGYQGARLANLYPELQSRLAALPGVASVSYASDMLLSGDLWSTGVTLPGQTKSAGDSDALSVGPSFFSTMGIRLLSGRLFTPRELQGDTTGSAGASPYAGPPRAVAVVNAAFARRFFGHASPLGRRFNIDKKSNPTGTEIVGEVADTKYDSLRKAIAPTIFYPFAPGYGYFQIRSALDPAALIPSVRRAVATVAANLPLSDVHTQTELIDRTLFNERLMTGLSSLFSLLALALAAIGVYGLLSYEVAGRRREIGIRMALGARESNVLGLIIGRGLALVAAGAAVGIAAAFILTRYLQSILFEVRPDDPLTLVGGVVLLALVAFAACYIPARRAARVDPMVALRCE